MSGSKIIYKASAYQNQNRTQKQASFQVLHESFNKIRALKFPVHAVDIGSGTGNVTELLTNFPNVCHVLGMDISQDMVEMAQSNYQSRALSFVQADLEVGGSISPEHAGKYDLATSFSTLHWMSDIESGFSNIAKLLRPGGLFVAQFNSKKQESKAVVASHALSSKWESLADKSMISRHNYEHAKWLAVENPAVDVRKMLENAGFEVHRCDSVTTVTYAMYDNLKAKVATYARSMVNQDNEAKFQEFLEEACQKLVVTLQKDHDHYIVPAVRIFIEANKK